MINVSDITQALYDVLREDSDLLDLIDKRNIVLSEFINCDESIASSGWIGIFDGAVNYSPKTLGPLISSFEASIELYLYVQYADFSGGKHNTDKLNKLVETILLAINTNRKLGGAWDMLTGIAIQPRVKAERDSDLLYQTRFITLTGEKRP